MCWPVDGQHGQLGTYFLPCDVPISSLFAKTFGGRLMGSHLCKIQVLMLLLKIQAGINNDATLLKQVFTVTLKAISPVPCFETVYSNILQGLKGT